MTSPLRDRDRLYQAIGRVVVEFQKTERELTEVLAALLDAKDKNKRNILLGALSFGQKIDLFAALYHQTAKREAWTLCALACRYLKTAEEFRNHVIHSDYYVVAGTDWIRWIQKKVTIKGGKGLRLKKRWVDIAVLTDGADVMRDLWLEATSFHFLSEHTEEVKAKPLDGIQRLQKRPNKAPEPTTTAVTPRAIE